MKKDTLTLLALSAGLMIVALEIRQASRDVVGREETRSRQQAAELQDFCDTIDAVFAGTNEEAQGARWTASQLKFVELRWRMASDLQTNAVTR